MLYKIALEFSNFLVSRIDYFSQRGSQNQDSTFHCFLDYLFVFILMCPKPHITSCLNNLKQVAIYNNVLKQNLYRREA